VIKKDFQSDSESVGWGGFLSKGRGPRFHQFPSATEGRSGIKGEEDAIKMLGKMEREVSNVKGNREEGEGLELVALQKAD